MKNKKETPYPSDNHCGKCGAPFWVIAPEGRIKRIAPICKCWNTHESGDQENELEERRSIMAEISGYNTCMDDERLAKAFILTKEKVQDIHLKWVICDTGDGDEEAD